MWRRPTVWLTLVFLFVVAAAVVELKSRLADETPPPSPTTASSSAALVQPTILPDDPVLGSPQAPVTIIVFSDFQCPFCAQVAPILRAALAANPGELRLVWKDFPLPQHAAAAAAAEAAQCAAAQGKFWEYHDRLFQAQASLGEATYRSMAGAVALNETSFAACRRNHERQPLVERNIKQGKAAGVAATPYLLVNGLPWSGAFTADELAQMIQVAGATAR